jgi:3-oxoacyl-[acyl-carrier-protein] synthase I
MREITVARDNIITSLGCTTAENMQRLEKGVTGIHITKDPSLYGTSLPLSLVDTETLEERFSNIMDLYGVNDGPDAYTRLEKLFIASIHRALHNLPTDIRGKNTLFVLSTTKGNIDLLEPQTRVQFPKNRLMLWEMGRVVQKFLGIENPPMIISNACISGVMAIMTAVRMLQEGTYEHAIVSGGDIVSEFVISGFMSFQSLSPKPCKPYDANRDGLSLGEGCGTLILTADPTRFTTLPVKISGGAVSNDANHISGPSRTGEELHLAIEAALREANLDSSRVDLINAHGTATPFNDEMESKAFGLSHLENTPLNSLKGYWGHTLGAAGVIETIVSVRSMIEGIMIKSLGFEETGTPVPLNVLKENKRLDYQTILKTASGFGGCNAAITIEKL